MDARRTQRPVGFTTVELLVTLAIILAVTALSLPQIKRTLRSVALKRSTNVLLGAFNNARTLASRDGRAYGVHFQRSRRDITPGQSGGTIKLGNADLFGANVCNEIHYVTAAGEDGRIFVEATGDAGASLLQTLRVQNTSDPDDPGVTSLSDRQFRIWVPRSESEILFAAVDPGNNSFAKNLVRIGSPITLFIGPPGLEQPVRGTIADFKILNPTPPAAAAAAATPVAPWADLTPVAFPNGISPAAQPAPASNPPASSDFQITTVTKGVIDAGGRFDEPGVLIRVDWQQAADRSSAVGDLFDTADGLVANRFDGSTGTWPNAAVRVSFEIGMRPIKSALAPLTLPGRAAVDLSVSGWRADPTAFNVQAIVDGGVMNNPNAGFIADPGAADLDNRLQGITVMFAGPGAGDSNEILGGVSEVLLESFNPDTNRFEIRSIPPPAVLQFLVGYANRVLPPNVDDLSRYLIRWNNSTAVSPVFSDPAPPPPAAGGGDFPAYQDTVNFDEPEDSPWTPDQIPNVLNSECSWVSLLSATGVVRIDNVAPPIDAGRFVTEVEGGFSAAPAARLLTHRRINDSKRLIFGGP